MKSRLFFRAFCVGAVLLVPAGGLTVLGVGTGTAGAATTTLTIGSPSTLTFGSLGSATLAGVKAKETGTTGQYIIPKTTQIPIVTPTHKGPSLLVTTPIKFLITHSGSTITAAGIKKVTQLILKIKESTITFKCKILGIKAITLTSSGGKWKVASTSLSEATVKATTCTIHSTIQNEIISGTLTGSLSLSLT